MTEGDTEIFEFGSFIMNAARANNMQLPSITLPNDLEEILVRAIAFSDEVAIQRYTELKKTLADELARFEISILSLQVVQEELLKKMPNFSVIKERLILEQATSNSRS
jgi:hypothetical protein